MNVLAFQRLAAELTHRSVEDVLTTTFDAALPSTHDLPSDIADDLPAMMMLATTTKPCDASPPPSGGKALKTRPDLDIQIHFFGLCVLMSGGSCDNPQKSGNKDGDYCWWPKRFLD
jgi:hypothetical protein